MRAPRSVTPGCASVCKTKSHRPQARIPACSRGRVVFTTRASGIVVSRACCSSKVATSPRIGRGNQFLRVLSVSTLLFTLLAGSVAITAARGQGNGKAKGHDKKEDKHGGNKLMETAMSAATTNIIIGITTAKLLAAGTANMKAVFLLAWPRKIDYPLDCKSNWTRAAHFRPACRSVSSPCPGIWKFVFPRPHRNVRTF